MSKIISLRAENIKKLKAIRIEPTGGPIVTIAGKNGQGKSSVLDSIEYAMAGKSALCVCPVRNGEKEAIVVCEVDDLVVTRTIRTDGNNKLVVNVKKGGPCRSPQKVLDGLVGKLSFDPQEFTQMEPAKQLIALKELAGLDFTKQDDQRARLYGDRTEVNREIKRLQAQVGDEDYRDTPDEPVSVEKLAADLNKINHRNSEQERTERDHAAAMSTVEVLTGQLEQARQDLKELAAKLETHVVADPAPLIRQMKEAHETNTRVVHKQEARKKQAELGTQQITAKNLTAEIDMFDEMKRKKIERASFPVEGLGLDDTTVTYRGIPLDQVSTSERIRISVAIGLAMNPKLRVLLVRNGNDLDADNLEMVRKMAEEADAQVWIERIEGAGESVVVIEDGEVV
jgi:DNA repair exonuclease SbcCD ATPase subunit